MVTYLKKALLLDGETLYGVSERQGKGASPEAAEGFDFAEWSFATAASGNPTAAATGMEQEGETGAEEGDAGAMSPRAGALAAAVREMQIEDGVPLALPPDVLVTRVLSLPAADAESIASMVRLKMEKFAPVADSELEVDYEVVGVTETETRVFAVAVPVSTLDALAADLEASGLAVTRIDSSLLCEWHSLSRHESARQGEGVGVEGVGVEGVGVEGQGQGEGVGVGEGEGQGQGEGQGKEGVGVEGQGQGQGVGEGQGAGEGKGSVYAIELPSGRIDLIAADVRGPVFARTLGADLEPEDFVRETTLSLLDLAAENPGFAPERFVLVSPRGADSRYAGAMGQIAGGEATVLRTDEIMPFVEAALEREDEEGCIDIVPASWRDDENAAVAKRRFIYGAIAAVAVWAVAFAALKLIPKNIERQTASVRREIATLMPRYSEVAELRARVRLIQSYEDRSRSALETLRELCVALPEDVTLATFGYEKNDDNGSSGRRGGPGGIRITGDAASADSILVLKDTLDEKEMFDTARLKGPTMDGQRRRHKFELDWRFAEGGE